MSEKQNTSAVINGLQDVDRVLAAAKAKIVAALAGGPVVMTLGRPRRGSEVNSKYHAMIGDIHHQCFRGHTPKGVKAVLVNQFAIEMAEQGTPLRHPGETAWDWKHQQAVYVRPSTTDFTKAEASAFIEWLYAAGADLDVTWSEPALREYEAWARENGK